MSKIYIARDSASLKLSNRPFSYGIGINGNRFFVHEDNYPWFLIRPECIKDFMKIIGVHVGKKEQKLLDVPDIKQYLTTYNYNIITREDIS